MASALLFVALVLFVAAPLRYLGGAFSDDRIAIYFTAWTISEVASAIQYFAEAHTIAGVIATIGAILSALLAWSWWHRTKRLRRVAKLIGEKARLIRNELVRTYNEAAGKLRPALPLRPAWDGA